MKTFPLNILILYSDSAFTPWKENINAQTVVSLVQAMSLQHHVTITHFNCMDDCFASFLKRFDLVYNVCYGFENYSQTDIAGWLDANEIPHTSSSYAAQMIAQDKGMLPSLCDEMGLYTPRLLDIEEILQHKGTMLLKPRFGSLHRGIHIFNEHQIPFNLVLDKDNLVQPYINGKEFTVAVLPTEDGKSSVCLPPVEVVPFEQKEMFIAGNASGKTYINYEPAIETTLRERIMNHVLRLHRRIGLMGMSRTDVRVLDNKVYILDVNAMPNIEPKQSFLPNIGYYNGITYAELINRMVNCFHHHYYQRQKEKMYA
ncbi:MAG: ATP-grasp domain-containing protein [Chitinophagaceae bacterium]|jgi:D-alanine-D-alanine ligase|nr:ATP-grasp domain-containing protein [Chitinophagaceae bacterium]